VVATQPLVRKVQTYGTVAFDPSLYNALAEYREAVRARDEVSETPIPEVKKQSQNMVDAARLKLKLLGIAPSQIQNEKGLLINERGRGVWVYAELYEQDIPLVRSGIQAVITSPALPGQTFQGKVRSIDPTINPITRTSRARIELQTVNENLHPEMLVDVMLEVPLGKRLSLPTTAIFDTGREQYVYVETDDHNFFPKPIKMGVKLADFTEVLDGVKEGDHVVTQANFLIDSESRFQAPSAATTEGSPQHGEQHHD
jgi:Cu(I)/Ag(I) efflux system membrane fusion protein